MPTRSAGAAPAGLLLAPSNLALALLEVCRTLVQLQRQLLERLFALVQLVPRLLCPRRPRPSRLRSSRRVASVSSASRSSTSSTRRRNERSRSSSSAQPNRFRLRSASRACSRSRRRSSSESADVVDRAAVRRRARGSPVSRSRRNPPCPGTFSAERTHATMIEPPRWKDCHQRIPHPRPRVRRDRRPHVQGRDRRTRRRHGGVPARTVSGGESGSPCAVGSASRRRRSASVHRSGRRPRVRSCTPRARRARRRSGRRRAPAGDRRAPDGRAAPARPPAAWAIDVVEPLEGDKTALIWRIHDAMADGQATMAIGIGPPLAAILPRRRRPSRLRRSSRCAPERPADVGAFGSCPGLRRGRLPFRTRARLRAALGPEPRRAAARSDGPSGASFDPTTARPLSTPRSAAGDTSRSCTSHSRRCTRPRTASVRA